VDKKDKDNVQQLRNALLELHKNLLHAQKRQYEKKAGKLSSRGALYELVVSHPDFAWIRQLSELIVGIDGMLDNKKPLQPANLQNFIKYTRKLLTTSQAGTKFEKEYHRIIQEVPAVAISHATVMQLLRKISNKKELRN
jgi:hypothetical protein